MKYEVVEENLQKNHVFAKKVKTWFKIRDPKGRLSLSAYLKRDIADKICEELNKDSLTNSDLAV